MSSNDQFAPTGMQANHEAGPKQIGELLMAYRTTRALTTAIELGVFDALAPGPRTAANVAQAIQADPRLTEVLLDALASVGFVRKHAEQQEQQAVVTYTNTDTGQRYLVSDSAESVASNLRYQEKLAPAWAALPEVIRSGRPHCSLIELLEEDPQFTEHYIRGMAEIARPSARDLVRQLDLTRCKTALDVGGGPGTYAAALAEANPSLQVDLLDLSPTLQVAESLLAGTPGGERVRLQAGDYLESSYGTDAYDLVLLSHVTHDEGEPENLKMLQRAHQALKSGGMVVVHDFMVDVTRTRPTYGALFALHLAAYTQKGRTYSSDEYCGWMHDCGFGEVEQLSVCRDRPNGTNALIGIKP